MNDDFIGSREQGFFSALLLVNPKQVCGILIDR